MPDSAVFDEHTQRDDGRSLFRSHEIIREILTYTACLEFDLSAIWFSQSDIPDHGKGPLPHGSFDIDLFIAFDNAVNGVSPAVEGRITNACHPPYGT